VTISFAKNIPHNGVSKVSKQATIMFIYHEWKKMRNSYETLLQNRKEQDHFEVIDGMIILKCTLKLCCLIM